MPLCVYVCMYGLYVCVSVSVSVSVSVCVCSINALPTHHTAVEAVLRGEDNNPRLDSISVSPNHDGPPLPLGPRPPIQHNGRHSSTTSRSPLPPPPIARPTTHISAPPVHNRSISPASPPLSQDTGPPLPDRRPVSASHRPNVRRDLPPRTPSNVTTVEEAEPQRDNSSPVLPPRQVTGGGVRSNPPLPPMRPGSQRAASASTPRTDSKPSTLDSKPGRPPPGGSRPRPSLPSRPKPGLPPGKPTKPSGRGGGGGGGVVPNIPTGEGMTPREMIDVAQKEIPNLLGAVSNRNSGVPKCLENICVLSENIADQARCSGIKYRFALTNLRSNVGTLKESSHASWHTNADRIIETLKSVLGHMETLSRDLVE